MTATMTDDLITELGPLPRRFALCRHRDPSGVSGTGVVALGTDYPGGPTVLVWRSQWPSVTVWRGMDDLLRVHGHDGATEVVWFDRGARPVSRGLQHFDYLP